MLCRVLEISFYLKLSNKIILINQFLAKGAFGCKDLKVGIQVQGRTYKEFMGVGVLATWDRLYTKTIL